MKLYKVLRGNRSTYQWHEYPLPTQRDDGTWQPSEWLSMPGTPLLCEAGLHLATERGLWNNWYLWGATVYEAEGDGESDASDDKVAFQRVRLLRPVPLPTWLQAAHEFVDSIADVEFSSHAGKVQDNWRVFESRLAAGDAAWGAAEDAARDAALRAAGRAARRAAGRAARRAARLAAGDAAWVAAGDAAWDAARRAAWDAAWGAARDAARDAAEDAQLLARCLIVQDVIDDTHLAYARQRWAVWQAGYGLYADVNGTFYVYRKEQ